MNEPRPTIRKSNCWIDGGKPSALRQTNTEQVWFLGAKSFTSHCTLAGSSYEGATFQAAVLNKNLRPDISTKGNLFEFM